MPHRFPSCQGSFIMVINSLQHFFAAAAAVWTEDCTQVVRVFSGPVAALGGFAAQKHTSQNKKKKNRSAVRCVLLPDQGRPDLM